MLVEESFAGKAAVETFSPAKPRLRRAAGEGLLVPDGGSYRVEQQRRPGSSGSDSLQN